MEFTLPDSYAAYLNNPSAHSPERAAVHRLSDLEEFHTLRYSYITDFPGMIFFATDGCSDFLFDTENQLGRGAHAVFMTDRTEMSIPSLKFAASDFETFLTIADDTDFDSLPSIERDPFYADSIERMLLRKKASAPKISQQFTPGESAPKYLPVLRLRRTWETTLTGAFASIGPAGCLLPVNDYCGKKGVTLLHIDLMQGTVLREYEIPQLYLISAVSYSPKLHRAALLESSGKLIFCDLSSGETSEFRTGICSAEYSSDGEHLLLLHETSRVEIVSAESGKPVIAFTDSPLPGYLPFHSAAFSPDGSGILTFSAGEESRGNQKSSYILRQFPSGKIIGTAPAKPFRAYPKMIRFSPDGSRACAVHSGELSLWNIRRAGLLRKIRFEEIPFTFDTVEQCHTAEFLTNDLLAVSYGDSVIIIDLCKRKCAASLERAAHQVTDLHMHRQGETLCTAVPFGDFSVWDLTKTEHL